MSDLSHLALERGDLSGHARLMLAQMHLMKREHDEAQQLGERAIEERPSCQGAYSLAANILNYSGCPDEAIPLAKQAIRLSPVAEPWFPEVLATSQYLCGRYEEAIADANQSLALAPDNVNLRLVLAASLAETGRLESAREAGREIYSIDPSFTLKRYAPSQPYRDPATLERLLGTLRLTGLGIDRDLETAPVSELSPQHVSRRRIAPRPRR